MANKYKGTSQAVDRREHDLDKEARRVIGTDAFGGILTDGNYTTYLEYSGDNPLYIGKAQIGTATSASEWQIKKFIFTGSNLTSILWASGTDGFTNVWDNRAALSYS